MANLRPLAEGLSDECREFATMLRELFDGLGVSVRRYAARRYRDPGTISRYLNGGRVPPWEFVLDLLTDLAAARGTAVTPDAVELLRERHRAAIHTSGSVGHAVEVLQNQLADADRAARSATVREDALGEALLERQHRIADLEVRLSQLEGAWAAERARVATLEQARPEHDREQLLREQERLRQEVRRLTDELEEVRRRGMLAEDRCQLLERQLAAVEAQGLATGEADAAGVPTDPARTAGVPTAPPPAEYAAPTGQPDLTGQGGFAGQPRPTGRAEPTRQPGATGRAGFAGPTDPAGQPGLAGHAESTGRIEGFGSGPTDGRPETPSPAAPSPTAPWYAAPGGSAGGPGGRAAPGWTPPAAAPAAAPWGAMPPPTAPPPDRGERPKILIVDDQRDNLLAMEAVLATLGQELVAATSGREALKALLDHDDFAVILLDVQMPEMDGYETAAQIKRRPRNRDIPILFLTAMGADPEHSSRGYAAGAVDYIAKPVDPWALRAKVSTFTEIFLERRRYSHRG